MNMFVECLRYFKILHSVCKFLNFSFTLLKGDRIDEFVVGATKSPFVVTGKALLMRESNILPDFVYATYLYHFSVYYFSSKTGNFPCSSYEFLQTKYFLLMVLFPCLSLRFSAFHCTMKIFLSIPYNILYHTLKSLTLPCTPMWWWNDFLVACKRAITHFLLPYIYLYICYYMRNLYLLMLQKI